MLNQSFMTDSAQKVLESGRQEAGRTGCGYFATEHIFYAILLLKRGSAWKTLESQGLTPERVEPLLIKDDCRDATMTVGAKQLVDNAAKVARRSGHKYVSIDDLLVSALENSRTTRKIIRRLGADPDYIKASIAPAASSRPE